MDMPRIRLNPPTPAGSALRRARWIGVLSLALGLAACGGGSEAPAPAADVTGTGQPTESAARPLSAAAPGEFARKGDQALREQRLFQPPGDNAFEYYLAAVGADATDERARLALQDLVPYAVLHVEQRLAVSDTDEANRVIELLARASADAPALPRLRASLAELLDREAQLRASAAAAPAVVPEQAPTPASAPAASAAPTPAPPQTVREVDPAPPPPLAAPAPPPAAAPAALTAAEPTPVRVPEVVYRPPLRYPAMAERRRIEGFVEMEFSIEADGGVSQVEILRSAPEGVFDREAVAAMERWRFAPPPAAMRARRTLEFKLAR